MAGLTLWHASTRPPNFAAGRFRSLSSFFSCGLEPPSTCGRDEGGAFGIVSKDLCWNGNSLGAKTQNDYLAQILNRVHRTPCQAHFTHFVAVKDSGRCERKIPRAATLIRPHKFTEISAHDKIISRDASEKGEISREQHGADCRKIEQAEPESPKPARPRTRIAPSRRPNAVPSLCMRAYRPAIIR
jgi:hypothetical protein